MNARIDYSPLSVIERAILMGSLLGDGTLQKRGKDSYRYRVSQCLAQKAYVEWKYKKLQRLCKTTQPPKEVTDKKGFVTVEFYTSSGLYLKELFELHYKQVTTAFYLAHLAPASSKKVTVTALPSLLGQGQTISPNISPRVKGNGGAVHFIKTITPELIDKLPMDPTVLAVLFMEDGSIRNDCYSGKIATQCFSLEEQHLLCDYFTKWDIDCNIVKHTKKRGQYYLSIPTKSFPKLVTIIEPIVRQIPAMVYKLNDQNKPRND
jgi:hypothetical protein